MEIPTTLKGLLELGMGAGGAWFSTKVVNWIKGPDWTADQKTYWGIGISAAIGIVLWLFGGVVMGYVELPPTSGAFWWRPWIESLTAVGLTTAIAAKVWYDKTHQSGE